MAKISGSIEGYILGRVIGKGSFGTVQVAQDKASNQVVAIKSIQKAKILTDTAYEFLRSEKEILSQIHNEFVVQYFGSFQDEDFVYFVQEFVPGGELFSLITRLDVMSLAQAKLVMAEIVLFLNQLHKQGIVYRDLKPENILISATGHVKIVDFGFASKIEEQTKSFCGTLEYLAPEIVKRNRHGLEVDWWTCGVLLYELLTGRSPFSGKSTNSIFEKIMNSQPCFPARIDADAKDLITKLLEKDPNKRIKGDEVQKHEFFKDLDWGEVEKQTYQTFDVPRLRNPMDVSYFPFYNEKSTSSKASAKYSFEGF